MITFSNYDMDTPDEFYEEGDLSASNDVDVSVDIKLLIQQVDAILLMSVVVPDSVDDIVVTLF